MRISRFHILLSGIILLWSSSVLAQTQEGNPELEEQFIDKRPSTFQPDKPLTQSEKAKVLKQRLALKNRAAALEKTLAQRSYQIKTMQRHVSISTDKNGKVTSVTFSSSVPQKMRERIRADIYAHQDRLQNAYWKSVKKAPASQDQIQKINRLKILSAEAKKKAEAYKKYKKK